MPRLITDMSLIEPMDAASQREQLSADKGGYIPRVSVQDARNESPTGQGTDTPEPPPLRTLGRVITDPSLVEPMDVQPAPTPGFFEGLAPLASPSKMAASFMSGYESAEKRANLGKFALGLGSAEAVQRAADEAERWEKNALTDDDVARMGTAAKALHGAVTSILPGMAHALVSPEAMTTAAVGGGVGAAAGAAGMGVGAIPVGIAGAATGYGYGVTGDFYLQSVGDILETGMQNGIDYEDMRALAIVAGVPYAALERLKLGAVAKPLLKPVARAMAKKGVAGAATTVLGRAASNFATEVGTEAAQQGLSLSTAAFAALNNGDKDKFIEMAEKVGPGMMAEAKNAVGPMGVLAITGMSVDGAGAATELRLRGAEAAANRDFKAWLTDPDKKPLFTQRLKTMLNAEITQENDGSGGKQFRVKLQGKGKDGADRTFLIKQQENLKALDPKSKRRFIESLLSGNEVRNNPDHVKAFDALLRAGDDASLDQAVEYADTNGYIPNGMTHTFKDEATGVERPVDALITLGNEADRGTLDHELFHAILPFFFTRKEYESVIRQFGGNITRPETIVPAEEAAAYAYQSVAGRRMAVETQLTAPERMLYRLATRIKSFTSGVMGKKADALYDRIYSGETVAAGTQTTAEEQQARIAPVGNDPTQTPVDTPEAGIASPAPPSAEDGGVPLPTEMDQEGRQFVESLYQNRPATNITWDSLVQQGELDPGEAAERAAKGEDPERYALDLAAFRDADTGEAAQPGAEAVVEGAPAEVPGAVAEGAGAQVTEPSNIPGELEPPAADTPSGEGRRYMVVGRNGVMRMAQQDRERAELGFNVAKQMTERGEDAEKIRVASGWWKAKDGKWRYEVSDKTSEVSGRVKKLGTTRKPVAGNWTEVQNDFERDEGLLKEFLIHPDLFRSYPELRDVEVSVIKGPDAVKSGALYTPDDGSPVMQVSGRTDEEVRMVLLHEAQHYVQRQEMFARGGSRDEMRPEATSESDAYRRYRQLHGEMEARDTVYRRDMTPTQRKRTPPMAKVNEMEPDAVPGAAEVRYSAARRDKEYMAAVERGDMDTAQRLVDEAARAAGYDKRVFHGTTDRDRKILNDSFEAGLGIFTTDNEDVAAIFTFEREYGEAVTEVWNEEEEDYEPVEPGEIISLYVKEGKNLNLEDTDIDPQSFVYDTALQSTTLSDAKRDGFDSVTVPDVEEGVGDWMEKGSTTVVFNSEQLKRSDPVTRDDAGNVIPLSKRFDAASPDIRYSTAKKPTRLRLGVDRLVDAAETMSSWKTWYEQYQEYLQELFGEDAELFRELLSATSQATGVKGNVSLAIKAYDQIKRGDPITGYLPAVAKNIQRAAESSALRGAKISQFSAANEGDMSAIAVDRHIAELFFGNKDPNAAQITKAKMTIRKVASRLGWDARQVQAALWAFNQVRKGNEPKSYDAVLKEREDAIKQLIAGFDTEGTAGGVRPRKKASEGGEARPEGEGVRFSTTSPFNNETMPDQRNAVGFPELVQMVREFLGRNPKIKQIKPSVAGAMRRDMINRRADILLNDTVAVGPVVFTTLAPDAKPDMLDKIRADQAEQLGMDPDLLVLRTRPLKKGVLVLGMVRDPEYKARVLAHEIGHLADWLFGDPAGTFDDKANDRYDRGNILGRIAGLRKYMMDTLGADPSRQGDAITPEEYEEIRQLMSEPAPAGWEWVTELVPDGSGITPEDIVSLFTSVDARDRAPELYKAFTALSDADRKRIAKAAMKGVVDPALAGVAGKTKEVKTRREVPAREKSKAQIMADIKAEVERLVKLRGLYRRDSITKELKALSQWWSPFNESEDAAYTRYRHSPHELYADAVSVLLNQPEALAERAPEFWSAMQGWKENKPEFWKEYTEIQDAITGGRVEGDRIDREVAMMLAAEAKHTEIAKEKKESGRKWTWDEIAKSIAHGLWNRASYLPKAAQQHYKDIVYSSGRLRAYGRSVHLRVLDPLRDAGVTMPEFGVYLGRLRASTERRDFFNPFDPDVPALRARFGNKKFDAMQAAQRELVAVRKEFVLSHVREAGLLPEYLMQYIEGNDAYAKFTPIEFLGDKIGIPQGIFKLFRQHGTFANTDNPLYATVEQDMLMMYCATLNKGKRDTIATLEQVAPGSVRRPTTALRGRKVVKVPPKEKNLGRIVYVVDGVQQEVYVDERIAELFQREPIKASLPFRILQAITIPQKGVLTTYNPLFGIWNFKRDFARFGRNAQLGVVQRMIHYGRTAQAAANYVFRDGLPEEAREMLVNGLLIAGRTWSAMERDSVEEHIERQVENWGDNPSRRTNFLMRAGKLVFNDWNQYLEVWTKFAAFDAMKKRGLTPGSVQMKEAIREQLGSPDFLAGGTATRVLNSVFIFSNANVQGITGDWGSFKKDPAWWLMHMAAYTILPAVMMSALEQGWFVDDDDDDGFFAYVQDLYRRIPEYDKCRMLPIPFRRNGPRAGYLPIPVDQTGALAHQTVRSLLAGSNIDKVGTVRRMVVGTIPWSQSNLNGVLDVAMDVMAVASGINPPDFFRGVDKIDPTVFEAGGADVYKEIAKNTWNDTFGGVSVRFDRRWNIEDKDSKLQVPKMLVGPLGRFYRESDLGLQDETRLTETEIGQESASQRKAVKDWVYERVNDGMKEPTGKAQWTRLYKDAVKNGDIPKDYSEQGFRALVRAATERAAGRAPTKVSPVEYADTVVGPGFKEPVNTAQWTRLYKQAQKAGGIADGYSMADFKILIKGALRKRR